MNNQTPSLSRDTEGVFFYARQTKVVYFSYVNIKSTENECCVALFQLTSKQSIYMVGLVLGTAAQVGGAAYSAIKSSQANQRAMALLRGQADENKRWYDLRMAEDYTQRADIQNILRKQRELFQEQYQRARATNVVAGGTDEALALQQQGANATMGETTAEIAAQAADYKEGVEQQYRARQAELAQQEIGIEQGQANAIAQAGAQVGSAAAGLIQGGLEKPVTDTGAADFLKTQQEFQDSFKPTLKVPEITRVQS